MPVPTVTLSGAALHGVGPHAVKSAAQALPTTVRLGRRRPKARPPALSLSEYLDLSAVQLPPSVDYAAKAMASLDCVYLNATYGCCVISDRFHSAGVWTANESGQALLGTDDEVLAAYRIWNPGSEDNGCVITDVLDYARQTGLTIGGQVRKIDGYVAVNWRNADLVRAAIILFGDLTLGVNLPEEWTRRDVWDVTTTQVVGGHDVVCVGYDGQGVTVSSWGRLYRITWAAVADPRWLEEAYAVLAPDWYAAGKAPSGFDATALRDDLALISGGHLPPLDPGPTPPPGPGPTPPPPPPPPAKRLFGLTFSRAVPKGGLVWPFRAPVSIPAGSYDVVASAAGGKAPPAPPP